MNNQRTRVFFWVALAAMCVQTVVAWVSQPAREMNQGHYMIIALTAMATLAVNAVTISLLAWQISKKHGPNGITALVVLPSLLWHGFALLPVTGLASREFLFWVNVVPEPTFNVVYHAVMTAAFAIVFLVSFLRRRAEVPQQG
ncbi:hypothetical protein OG205_18850 [Lentzea sp. NBC_00516]|uniref:hypothetical protein n=1 Tax=Lentzea sp. NBC_00516 TaxID=2903582 RepID=UPI002E814B8B|nr:hypothetical protein [Lentzea sp. NBC_00516]WUD28979.1 hypothetical protein OG205_18850 [Lentzea sp. NBC_00516]